MDSAISILKCENNDPEAKFFKAIIAYQLEINTIYFNVSKNEKNINYSKYYEDFESVAGLLPIYYYSQIKSLFVDLSNYKLANIFLNIYAYDTEEIDSNGNITPSNNYLKFNKGDDYLSYITNIDILYKNFAGNNIDNKENNPHINGFYDLINKLKRVMDYAKDTSSSSSSDSFDDYSKEINEFYKNTAFYLKNDTKEYGKDLYIFSRILYDIFSTNKALEPINLINKLMKDSTNNINLGTVCFVIHKNYTLSKVNEDI